MDRNIHYRVAVQTTAQRFRSQRPMSRLGAPVVVRAGPSYALLVSGEVVIETQAPESALHPHTHDFHGVVDPRVAAILVVVIVLVIVADKVVAWVFRASDGETIGRSGE
jgi:hypothetical protein